MKKTAKKANRPVAAFSWFGGTTYATQAPRKPGELEAEASMLASRAMRLRWQAQLLRGAQ